MRITRIAFIIAAFSAPAFSQGLTTIQDTLFKADGTRFNGSITIQWNTFDAANVGLVVQQSKTVAIVNGNVQVQLTPNINSAAPANVYTVLYQSGGRNQFTETWTVPVSAAPLKIASVRTGTQTTSPGTGTGGTGTGAQTPVLESDVVGLLTDLDQRPVKGSGFGTGRAAIINQNGELETAVGDAADCVRVDGTAGLCGTATPTYSDAETPGGTVDGVNNSFTLASTPSGSSLLLYRNGIYMTPGVDYNLTANTVQFIAANIPQPLDKLTASYRIDPAAGSLTLPNGGSTPRLVRSAQVICSATGISTGTNTYSSLGSCTLPRSSLNVGDSIEVRFTLAHTGSKSAYDVQIAFGGTTIIQRHASAQDAAFAGRVNAAVASGSIQVTTESYGSLLTLLPSILTAPAATADVKVDFRTALSQAGSPDRVALLNYTVLRYPAN